MNGDSVNKKHFIKKYIAIGIILLFVGICNNQATPTDILGTCSPSRGIWLYVGGSGPGNYTTIQGAINDANDGDTVFVFNGTYYGHVNINKSIQLRGQDKNTTIISGYIAYTVSIVSDWVFMSQFTIQNGKSKGEGVRIDSSHNSVINVIIDTPADEIRISGDNNTLSSSSIWCDRIFLSGSGCIFSGNSITNNYFGIYFLDSWDNIISQNHFFNSGLFLSDNSVGNNIVMNNTVNDKPLIYVSGESNRVLENEAGQILLVNCTNITVHNKEITNTTVGIQLVSCMNCSIKKNTVTGSLYGMCLNGFDNSIKENTIISNHYGIILSGNRNNISENILSDNDVGLDLDEPASCNTISDNQVSMNYYGLLLDYGSDSNRITHNRIEHNHDAVYLSSNGNILFGNIIHNNTEAVHVSGDNNNISENIIRNNNGSGLAIGDGDFTFIVNNAIAENKNGVFLSNSKNTTLQGNTIVHNQQGFLITGLKSKDTKLSNNSITANENGIILRDTNRHLITQNTISENQIGLYGNGSSNNTIQGNNIWKNKQGVILVSSTNNSLEKNNFLGNKRHALFKDSKNQWSQNYWGRPRFLPKLIFGTRTTQDAKPILSVDIDWHPAFTLQRNS